MAARTRAGERAALRVTTLLTASLLAVILAAGTPAVAFADAPVADPSPSATGPAGSGPAASGPTPSGPSDAAVRLAARIVELQRTAERTGAVAQKAGERANDARAAADTAARRLVAAQSAAAAATETARRSRARASATAAQLARTNLGTLPLDLLLNGGTAQGVLSGLSTTGQLSAQSRLLSDHARADEREAERLRAAAADAADAADTTAEDAAARHTAAEQTASSAKRAVESALAEQRALLTQGAGDLCSAVGSAPVPTCLPTGGAAPTGDSVGAEVVAYAMAQIGKPYIFAAAGPDAFDCSGLTLAAYAAAGVSIGIHSATAQYRLALTRGGLVPIADAAPGDLLFYTDGGGDMYHVTIAAGNGLMLEAPYPGATVRAAPIRTGDLFPLAAHFA